MLNLLSTCGKSYLYPPRSQLPSMQIIFFFVCRSLITRTSHMYFCMYIIRICTHMCVCMFVYFLFSVKICSITSRSHYMQVFSYYSGPPYNPNQFNSGFPSKRINLSPFTKDFRGGEQLNESFVISYRPTLVGHTIYFILSLNK